MSHNSFDKSKYVAKKKFRLSKNKKLHAATYYESQPKTNDGFSSHSLKGSMDQIAADVGSVDFSSSKAKSHNTNIFTSTVESFREANPSAFTSPTNAATNSGNGGNSGQPPISRTGFSSSNNEPSNHFSILANTAVPKAPKWGTGPQKHSVSEQLTVTNMAAVETLGKSLKRVNDRISPKEIKTLFANIS